jgi:hypothetical protein
MSKKDIHARLGKMCEDFVKDHLRSLGKIVEDANWFDREKDCIVDGLKAEIKGQVPWIRENAFTVRENQLTKITEADILYFVSVPISDEFGNTDHHGGDIFVCTEPKKLEILTKTTSRGTKMLLIKRGQLALSVIHTLSPEQKQQLKDAASSMWSPKNNDTMKGFTL